MKTRHFVAMVQEKEAEEKQKKETARAEKRAREEEAKNRQVLEAAAAEPTQPLVASTTVEDPSAAASAAASSVTAYDGLNLTSVENQTWVPPLGTMSGFFRTMSIIFGTVFGNYLHTFFSWTKYKKLL